MGGQGNPAPAPQAGEPEERTGCVQEPVTAAAQPHLEHSCCHGLRNLSSRFIVPAEASFISDNSEETLSRPNVPVYTPLCFSCPLPQRTPHILTSRSYRTPSRENSCLCSVCTLSPKCCARQGPGKKRLHTHTDVPGCCCIGWGGMPRKGVQRRRASRASASAEGQAQWDMSSPALVFRKRSQACRGHTKRSCYTFAETTSLEPVLRKETRRGIK